MAQAKSLMGQGRHEDAWRLLVGIDGVPSPDLLYLRAAAAMQCGEADDAETALNACLKTAPRHPGATFHLAALHLARGDRSAAMRGFAQATHLAPNWAEAHYNLAILQAESGDAAAAEASYGSALKAKPGLIQAAINLANLLDSRGDRAEAIALLWQALTHAPEFAQGWSTLGYLYLGARQLEAAETSLARAVSIDPTMADAWEYLAETRRQRGDREGAREAYQALIRINPDAEVAGFHLATLLGQTPSRPPDSFVRGLFDGMANEFEHKLVDVLGYRLPFELTRYLDDVLQTPTPLDVLDLGCGTGLCGQAIKPWAHRLHGVDVSPRMMELARARDVYDMLHEMELVEFLARCQDSEWDIVLAADVLVYLGALEALFGQARRVLRPGGRLMLSIEELDTQDDYALRPTGRYAHAAGYLERLAAEHGFTVERNEPIPLRRESGTMLPGRLLRLGAGRAH